MTIGSWCSKEPHPDSKYCDRHMHRGETRSRKPVEVVHNPTTKFYHQHYIYQYDCPGFHVFGISDGSILYPLDSPLLCDLLKKLRNAFARTEISLNNSFTPLTMSSPTGYSHSHFPALTVNDREQLQQEKNCFILGTNFE